MPRRKTAFTSVSRVFVRQFVPALYHGRALLKKWRAFIRQFERAPMLVRPGLLDFHLVDRLLETALGNHRDRKPFDAVRGLDTVTVVPMPLHILDAVEDHVFVALSDQVEKTLPRHVAGLNDGYALWLRRPLRGVGVIAIAVGAGETRVSGVVRPRGSGLGSGLNCCAISAALRPRILKTSGRQVLHSRSDPRSSRHVRRFHAIGNNAGSGSSPSIPEQSRIW